VEIRIFPFFFRCEVQELNCFRHFEPGQPRFIGSLGCFSYREDNVRITCDYYGVPLYGSLEEWIEELNLLHM
jgi:hypothetical protein